MKLTYVESVGIKKLEQYEKTVEFVDDDGVEDQVINVYPRVKYQSFEDVSYTHLETYWKGVLSHDLAVNPAYEEAGTFGREIAGIGKDVLCISRKSPVALVVDNQSLTGFRWFPIDKDLSYNDVVRRMYDCLYEMNIPCDVINIHQMEERFDQEDKPYQMIVTPVLYLSLIHILTCGTYFSISSSNISSL